ncbi:uncharacterized protein C8Q71DRAFT_495776 [Rhodofomes roseus]|uniref:Uncharacterized protein n=1 Tax=Rhodofomes roseus TaxID=34475 RepID=A0ABQ8KLB2_9APHY|nr:uncharacterized protein C8Q71DRAFT_495776 [Rhodofomes roseus]KAH9839103.1 hypothetical protein C8Q71DRAFT_495776 [Rhodofomes roseus]
MPCSSSLWVACPTGNASDPSAPCWIHQFIWPTNEANSPTVEHHQRTTKVHRGEASRVYIYAQLVRRRSAVQMPSRGISRGGRRRSASGTFVVNSFKPIEPISSMPADQSFSAMTPHIRVAVRQRRAWSHKPHGPCQSSFSGSVIPDWLAQSYTPRPQRRLGCVYTVHTRKPSSVFAILRHRPHPPCALCATRQRCTGHRCCREPERGGAITIGSVDGPSE